MSPPKGGPNVLKCREEMYNVMMKTFIPTFDTTKYKSFKYIGRFPCHTQFELKPRIELIEGVLARAYIGDELYDRIDSFKGDYVISRSTEETLDLSVRKMDYEPTFRFRTRKFYNLVVKWWKFHWKPCMLQDSLSPTEILGTMKMNTHPGYLEKVNGIKDKQDYFSRGGLSQVTQPSIMNERYVLWKGAGKVEKRTRVKYLIEKNQRTFIIEGSALLYHHKRLFGGQNQGMKMYWWSAYGFNPFEGGVAQIVRQLQRYKFYFMWDAVRWDRLFGMMKEINKLRSENTPPDPFKKWVCTNIRKSYVVLPNGDIIYKWWGNNSGSGTTTGDNILGMSLVEMDICAEISNGHEGVLENIDKYMWCQNFGDDTVGGCSFPGLTMEKFERVVNEVFSDYDVKLDPVVVTDNIEDLSFLGFSFKNDPIYGWVPKYDLKVLSTSFLYNIDKLEPEGEVSKLLTITLMSAGNGEDMYNMYREALLNVIINTQCELSKVMLSHGVPTYGDTMSWYVGFESASANFLNFLISEYGLFEEVVGTKR